jgi:AAA-like domain
MNQYNCPIVYFEDNIIVDNRGEFRALYRIPSTFFEYRSHDEQIQLAEDWESFLSTLRDECQLMMIPEQKGIEEYINQLQQRVVAPLKNTGNEMFERALRYLQQEGKHMIKYHFFVSMKLRTSKMKKGNYLAQIKKSLKDVKRYFETISGVKPFYFFDEEMEAYRAQEEVYYGQIKYLLNGERATTEDIQWLLKRSTWRGIDQPKLLKNWEPQTDTIEVDGKRAKKPRNDVVTLFGGLQDDNHLRMLVTEQFHQGKFRQGFMSFLYMSYLPDGREFPGTPWLYWLQDLNFPIEVKLHIKPVDFAKAIKHVRNKQKELEDQAEHMGEEHVPLRLREAIEDANQLEADLEKDRFPILETKIGFCLFASSAEVLEQRIEALMKVYQERTFHIEIPRGDQWRAFSEFFPGAPSLSDRYIHRLDPNYLACSMFGATKDLGDLSGPFLGKSGRSLVFVDSRRGPSDQKISTSPSIAFVGKTGSGKSMTVDFLALNELILGAQVVIVDPKNDRSHWIRTMPQEIKNVMQVVSLGQEDEDRGKLDPLVSDPKGGSKTAKRILKVLAAAKDGDYIATAIENAVDQAVESENPCMMKVLEFLRKHLHELEKKKEKGLVTIERYENFDTMLYTLEQKSKSGQSKLLFGDGSEESVNLQKQLTILQIQDLPLVGGNREVERLGLALLIALADFTRRFANQPTKHFKISVFDEAWRLAKTEEGRTVLEELIRTGRSQNSALFIVTQNARDLSFGDDKKSGDRGEEVRGNLGMRFVFRSEDSLDAESACRLLGIEATRENKNRLQGLKRGQCFMKDLEGRIGEVEVIIQEIHPELFSILDTRPNVWTERELEMEEI